MEMYHQAYSVISLKYRHFLYDFLNLLKRGWKGIYVYITYDFLIHIS